MSAARILHLEDNVHDADLVEATLAAGGLAATIVRVETRAAFGAALEAGPWDVILADYNLPGFDGLSAQRLAAERQPDVPFIFLSGSIGEELAVDRLKAGATDYVLKDRMARLPSAVRRALAEAAERGERRRAEREVLTLNAELEARVAERTAQLARVNTALQAAREEADRASRAKSEFLSRMSHDLRTPLNAVLGFAQLLDPGEMSEEGRESVVQILKGGEHLLELINEVLDIARNESGHLTLSPEPIDALEIGQHAVDLVAPLAAQRGIGLSIEPPADAALFVRADRQRLTQILLNLLSNAVKYNRPNGDVVVGFRTADARAQITITDTGAGIPPAKLALLFQPFERLGAEQTDVEGTGLGLALARGFAEAMGGRIGVTSAIDRGSTFWVELARSDEPEPGAGPAAGSAAHAEAQPVAGLVLYVEDNRSNVRLMERVLKRRPHVRLAHALCGEDGLRLAREERPDLILLDLHLPDMTGDDVVRQLWQDAELRDIPVAVLSADATPAHARRLQAAGAIAYLTKPLDISRVLQLLDDVLASKTRT